MDLGASDALGPLLRVVGLNKVLAAVVARLSVRQSITCDDRALSVVVSTRLSEDTLKLAFDGSVTIVPGITGGRAAATSRWLDDDRLETRQSLKTAENDVAAAECATKLNEEAFVTVRSLRDGGRTLVETCSVVQGGVALKQPRVERVLRREA